MKRDQTYYLAIFYFIIDQFTKALVTSKIALNQSIPIIPNFFSLTHVENTGAAWGILQNQTFIFVLFGAIAFLFLNRYLGKKKRLNKLEVVGFGLLLSGIMGNLIDRLLRDCVVDFLSFNFFGYHFPIFNLADVGIVVGVFLILLDLIKKELQEKKREKHVSSK